MSFEIDSITIIQDGSTVTSGATSAVVAIPTNAAGVTARAVRIICPVAATYAFVRPGISSTVATSSSICTTNTEELILNTIGCTHIAYIQGSAAATINIVPIEI
jgi:hypothetical protein